jgi:FMN-dependent NADH-azoreductase
MKILHLSCSPRGHAAESSLLAGRIVELLIEGDPEGTVISRDLGDDHAMPHIDANYAFAQYPSVAETSREGSHLLSEELIHELENSDVLVIGTPMHNWTVPSTLKAWIDHVVRARRTFNSSEAGKIGTLRDRPVFVAIASGARFSGEHAHQPDFLTPYLRYVLGIIGLRDVTFFSLEGTGLGAEAIAKARTTTRQVIKDHFSSPGHLAIGRASLSQQRT